MRLWLKRYTEDRKPSSKKFCKGHRLELYQGDIKYGPVIRDRDGKKIQTYLSSVIDDHSRLIIQSEWYDNQRKEIVEDTVHRAVLKYGVFDRFYMDNGKQYISTQLHAFCAARRTLMRFRADALRSKTDTLKRSLWEHEILSVIWGLS